MSLLVNNSERSFSASDLTGEAGLTAQRSERNALYLAPMEDVTDPAVRALCKRYGADRV